MQDTSKPAKAEKAPPLKWVTGDISADGTKLTTKSGKAWDIKNPDSVKGHEGRHVKVQARIYKSDNSIHVMEVKVAELACSERFCARACDRRHKCGNKGCDCPKTQ